MYNYLAQQQLASSESGSTPDAADAALGQSWYKYYANEPQRHAAGSERTGALTLSTTQPLKEIS